jgi:dTDP-4-amino-4,6-dideoxygalactose transaminase
VKAGRRDALQEHLKKHEIASAVYYRVPLHKMRLFDGACKIGGSLENAERACEEVLSLPIGPTMTRSEVAQVGNTIRQFYE